MGTGDVHPSEITLELDGRLLPGFTYDDVEPSWPRLLGEPLELEIIRHDPGTTDVDLSLFPLLTNILNDLDPARWSCRPWLAALPMGACLRVRRFRTMGSCRCGYPRAISIRTDRPRRQ
ncbi:MAG: hypothetical protein R2867_43015 [Caldilineaceae bacterium]